MLKTQLWIVAVVVGLALSAQAQNKELDELVPDDLSLAADAKKGWFPTLSFGAALQFGHSQSVAGQLDGSTFNVGPLLNAGIRYRGANVEWRNVLTFKYVISKTPLLEEWVKSQDQLYFESMVLYRLTSAQWFAPYALINLDTPVSPGGDFRPNDVDYHIVGRGEADETVVGRKLDLTDAFAPLQLRQAVGAMMNPVAEEYAKLEFRVGVGARETFVQLGQVVTETKPDVGTDGRDLVEVKRLEDFQQVGGEAYAGIGGVVTFESLGKDRPLIYGASVDVMIPFYSSIDNGKTLVDLTNVLVEAKLAIKLFSWMSLDYSIRALRQPLVIEDFQIQNNLLLNFSYIVY